PGLAFGAGPVNGGASGDPIAVLTGTWPAGAQTAQGVVSVPGSLTPGVYKEIELHLKMVRSPVNSNWSGYELNCSMVSTAQYMQIVKWNNDGSYAYIGSQGTDYCQNGDVLNATIDASGNINWYKNGVLEASATDTTYQTGNPGIGAFDNSDANWSEFGFSSFSAADNIGTGSASSASSLTTMADKLVASQSVASKTATLTLDTTTSTTNVLPYHNNNAPTRQNLNETIPTSTNVNSADFGKSGFLPVEGLVDAEPLYISNLMVSGAPHNVVVVVTRHDLVYAFDADTFALLWQVTLLGANETPSGDRGCSQITPEIGITATPVVDLKAGPHGTVFVEAMSKDNEGNYYQHLHALDLSTGSEQGDGPAIIKASFPNSAAFLTFDPAQYKVRASLLLFNGVIYLTWVSRCDSTPSNAWVMGYSETTLQQVSVFTFAPNGIEGSVWTSGASMAADSSKNIYFLAVNGRFDTKLSVDGFQANGDYSNALTKLSASRNSLNVADYLTTHNTLSESNADLDLGSGGALVIPDLKDALGNIWHLAVGAGKDGIIYLVNRDSVGELNPDNDNGIHQEIDSNGLGWVRAVFRRCRHASVTPSGTAP
ncbi:MAG: hypothetical protein P4L87_00800, partial [Formivibrio sp.]|nr:hypothetical protein [Formivibrio sp.]